MTGMWIIVGALLVIVAGLLVTLRKNKQKVNLLHKNSIMTL